MKQRIPTLDNFIFEANLPELKGYHFIEVGKYLDRKDSKYNIKELPEVFDGMFEDKEVPKVIAFFKKAIAPANEFYTVNYDIDRTEYTIVERGIKELDNTSKSKIPGTDVTQETYKGNGVIAVRMYGENSDQFYIAYV